MTSLLTKSSSKLSAKLSVALSSSILLTTSLFAVSPLQATPIAPVMAPQSAEQVAEPAANKKRRRTPALNSRVYSQLARAQALADEGNVAEGLAVLDTVKSKSDSLNSYETAMMYNFYGFIYYNAERIPEAINAFEMVVKQSPIPESLEKSTLYSLAQLSMANGDFDDTIAFLDRWEQVDNSKPPIKNLILKGQASYQARNYNAAANYIESARTMAKAEGIEVQESWLVLQRATYFELKQPLKVVAVLEEMVRRFNKPEYWTQLAGMYGETEQDDKQLAVLEAAYQQGYIVAAKDFRNLAQIYYFKGLPYKAAKVMESGLSNKTLEATEKNLQFLAQAWLAAKEYDYAVKALTQLAKLDDRGIAHQQIAEIRLQQGEYQAVIDSAKIAIERGELSNPGNLYIALGMAYFNLKQFERSIAALNSAKQYKSVQRMANQWLKYVEKEKSSFEQVSASLAAAE